MFAGTRVMILRPQTRTRTWTVMTRTQTQTQALMTRGLGPSPARVQQYFPFFERNYLSSQLLYFKLIFPIL